MSCSVFSLIMAILWFDAFILLSSTIRKKTGVLLQYSLYPLLALSVFSLVRVCVPIELPFATVLRSGRLMPFIQSVFGYQCSLFGLQLTVAWAVVILCSTVSVVLLVRLFAGLYLSHVRTQVFYSEEDERAKDILQEIIEQTKPGQGCTVRIAPGISSPVVTGFFHPVILMPEETQELSDKQLKYILCHEWCHFLSKDLWAKLLIHVLCCLMWWNPPVYLLKKDLDQILELNCDQRVTNKMSELERLEYLETILEFLRQYQERTNHFLKDAVGVGFIGINRAANTTQRFQMVYDYKKCKANWKTNLAFTLVMMALFVASYSFVLQPWIPVADGPADDGISSYVMITPENAYLQLQKDGSYSLFVNGVYFETVTKSDLYSDPYNKLPITKE